jgi:hypothetical protein
MLPAGAEIAVLAGNPTEAVPYTVRLKFPAHYQIPADSHPTDENVVIVSGALTDAGKSYLNCLNSAIASDRKDDFAAELREVSLGARAMARSTALLALSLSPTPAKPSAAG